MRRPLLIIVAAAVVVGLATGAYVYSTTLKNGATRYRLAKVERGSLVASVSASGTLNAVTTVQVGSQISGMVKQILADYNSPVTKGQLIARIDPETLEAKVSQARADLESSQAAVLNQQAAVQQKHAEVDNALAAVAGAQANTAKARVGVADAKRTLDRQADLLQRGLVAQSDKDTAQATYDSATAALEATRAQEQAAQSAVRSAQAQLKVAEAQLRSAEAQVRQKQAALAQAQVDLDHTFIRAPVNGVVVSRNVDVGQTVAASLQAPVLFTIAQDLTRMQVDTSVDEADIGRIREGMEATFTVDAFPGEAFRGQVVQIRQAPQVVQNVVTYIVVIAVSNPNKTLKPGMTANVRLVVDRRENTLKVPNAGLRFRPQGEGPREVAQRPTQDSGSPPALATGPGQGGPGGGQGRGGSGGGRQQEELRQRLITELALTREQQSKLDAIQNEQRQQFRAGTQQGLDEKAREAQRQRLLAESREKIKEMLTPDQKRKFEQLFGTPGGRGGPGSAPVVTPGRVYALGPDGKPQAVQILYGLTDGTSTEIVRGDLKEGQEVIIGSNERTQSRGPTPGRFPIGR